MQGSRFGEIGFAPSSAVRRDQEPPRYPARDDHRDAARHGVADGGDDRRGGVARPERLEDEPIGSGRDTRAHVQVVGAARDDMVKEAETILDRVDDEVYIKVPTTEEGLAAMQLLKQRGVRVSATAVYTRLQGFMAVAAGADYIAPYVNRVSDVDVDPRTLIASIAKMIEAHKAPTKIVAASFKNITQVNEALLAAAHAVTVQPRLLHGAFGAAAIGKAVNDFAADWHSIVGDTNFAAL